MATPIVETLSDLLSASSGALVGAIVTGLFNRGHNKTLSAQVLAGQAELERQQAENRRLLGIIKDREETIMKMEMDMMERGTPKKRRK